MTRLEVFAKVQDVLSDAVHGSGRPKPSISESSHLLADLGLTSVDFAEVTIGLEEQLEITEFPITDWLKREAQRSDPTALTVGALVDACVNLVANGNDVGSRVSAGPSIPDRAPLAAPSASESPGRTRAWTVLALALCAAVVGIVFALR